MTKKARTASEKFAMIHRIEARHIGVQDAVKEAVERFGITKNNHHQNNHHQNNYRQMATSISRVWLGGIKDSYSSSQIFR